MDLRLSPEDRIAAERGAAKPAAPRRGRAEPAQKAERPSRKQQRAKRRGGARPWSIWRAFGQLFRLGLVLAFWGVVAGAGVIAYYGAQLPDSSSWAVPDRPPNIRVLAANGQIITNRGQTGGEAVAYHELPRHVPLAIIANEDRRFYQHFGVDPIGLAAVAVESVRAGRMTRGASTITQQVARTLFLNTDQTVGRKVQEALLAIWLEQNYTKEEILELYLNRVHFGAGATGIEAAAQTYFGISARNLSLGQAAMLAGILPSPANYNPRSHPQRALERQRLTLANMVREGFITPEEAAAAQTPDTEPPSFRRVEGAEFYVADWVETLMNAYLGEVNQDVIVYTTLDLDLQRHAERVVQQAILEYGESRNFNQAALVAMDTRGHVKALVGGVDYSQSQYNRAVTARRQPGSAFKPFVYLAALQHGYTPDTLMVDEPLEYNGWSPQNYGRDYRGPVLLREALAASINTVAARLAIDIGPESVVETAYRLGFSNQFQPVPSIALGAQEVSLLELTGAYAPFANGGVGVIPTVITRITTMDGEVLYEDNEAGPGQVLTAEQVGMMNDMMRAVVTSGTGTNARFGDWPIGGKTGTTQSSRDALFVGYTAHMVAGVWLGNDDDSPTRGMTGGAVPSQIWANFMGPAHQGVPVADLPGHYVRLADRMNQPAAPAGDMQMVQPGGQMPVPVAPEQMQQAPQPIQQAPQPVPVDGIGRVLDEIFAAPPQ